MLHNKIVLSVYDPDDQILFRFRFLFRPAFRVHLSPPEGSVEIPAELCESGHPADQDEQPQCTGKEVRIHSYFKLHYFIGTNPF